MSAREVRRGLGRFALLLGVYIAGMVVGELNTWAASILIGLPIGALLAYLAANRDQSGPLGKRRDAR